MPPTSLFLTIRDGRTGEKVPARIHLKRADGSPVPPPAPQGRFTERSVPPYIVPAHFRKNLHLKKDIPLASVHLTSGEAQIPLPPGEYALFVQRGYESRPATARFLVKPREPARVEVLLESLEPLAERGWHGGDLHVHFSRFARADDFLLARLLAAEDLRCVNNMVYKHAGRIEAPQRTLGHEDSHFDLFHSHQIVAGGEEFRDDDLYGHIVLAGIRKVIEPVSVGPSLGRRECWPLMGDACDAAHAQGGIAGWAHGGCIIKLGESLPMEAALRKLDFVESIQFNNFFGFFFWYRLLNCGLRLAITGGSDFPFGADTLAPWYPNLGRERTYVPTGRDRPFSYESFTEGVRRGRTFATSGPLIFLDVEGRGPGAVLRGPPRRPLTVRARARCIHPLERLEIVVNGAVVKGWDGRGGAREITGETRLRPGRSVWIAARARGRVPPAAYGGLAPWNLHAHTSPVYVHAAGRPVREPADATFMADYLRMISERYRKLGTFTNEDHRAALFDGLRRAEGFYEGLLRDSH